MSAVVTIVIGIIVILLILLSAFGPGNITKQLNKMFFGEQATLIPKIDDYVVPGTVVGEGTPHYIQSAAELSETKITGTKEKIAQVLAEEMKSCWKTMRATPQRFCTKLCLCLNSPCTCTTKTAAYAPDSAERLFLPFVILKLLEDQEKKDPLLKGIGNGFLQAWQHSQRHSANAAEFNGFYPRTTYLLCASKPDHIYITDNLNFNCQWWLDQTNG